MIENEIKKKAVILMSGGLDSTTVLAIASQLGFECHALSVDYGQRHVVELEALKKVLEKYPVREHKRIDLNLSAFGGSALTEQGLEPQLTLRKASAFEPSSEIPNSYVPARNLIFLSLAVGYAEVIGSQDVFIGVNAIDYSNYPDCRADFLRSFAKTAQLATAAGVLGRELHIHAPLLRLTKVEIIKKGLELGVDYSLTITCYDPSSSGKACGLCDACHLRLNAFQQLSLADPANYSKS